MKYTIIDGELYRTDELYHHGVKGMRWGVRRERKSRAERIKERAEVRKARETAKQERLAYKAQTQKLKADLVSKTNERLKAEQTRRELSVKMSKKDRKLIAKLKGEQAVAAAEADKLAAQNRIRDEKKKAQSVIQKVLSKLGWSAIEGVAEAGKNLVKDKLIAFGKDKLGLNTKDELSKLKEEADLLETKNRIKKAKGEKDELSKLKEEADLLETKDRIKKAKGEKDELTRTREEAELLETQARLKRAKGEDADENARLKAQRLENEEKIATKTKAAEERERENKQREAEEAALQRRLKELSNRSSEHINRSANDDIDRGVEAVQKALKAAESKQKQDEYRRKREELLRKNK